MGLLKLVVFAALLGCSQAFVAPASSLVVRSRADAVSAQMLFGAKKPVAKKGKKVQHAQPRAVGVRMCVAPGLRLRPIA